LRVGGVWRDGFDLRDEVLVEEELADVRDVAAGVGAVGVLGAVEVGEDVDVSGAAGVVAWEEGLELSDALVVGRL